MSRDDMKSSMKNNTSLAAEEDQNNTLRAMHTPTTPIEP